MAIPLAAGKRRRFLEDLACLFGSRPVDRLEFFSLKRVVGFEKRLDFVQQAGAGLIECFEMA